MLATADARYLDCEEHFDLLLWRYERLVAAGYESHAASELAIRADIDLQVAESLLARGCSISLALRILR
jgi:hypothetical protein